MKKYELLVISNTIQKKREVNEIVSFLSDLLNESDNRNLMATYELTLLVYNLALNTFSDFSFFLNKQINPMVKQMVMEILQNLYQDKLTDAHRTKIHSDIRFIQTQRQYVYIFDIILLGYTFFF